MVVTQILILKINFTQFAIGYLYKFSFNAVPQLSVRLLVTSIATRESVLGDISCKEFDKFATYFLCNL